MVFSIRKKSWLFFFLPINIGHTIVILVLDKILLGIEKVLMAFLISDKISSKSDLLTLYICKFMMFQIIDLFDLYLFATEIGYGLVLGRGLLLLTHNSKDKILGVGLDVGLFFFER